MRLSSVLSLFLLLVGSALAQGPRLELVYPRAVQLGTEVDLQLRGRGLGRPREIHSSSLSLEILEITREDPRRVDVRVRVPADAPRGLHGLRIVTDAGISGVQLLAVTDLVPLDEQEPNQDTVTAQVVPFGTAIRGVAGDEDKDLFLIDCEAGEEVCLEVLGLRLGDRLFDPALRLLDPRGFTLASSDDAALSRQDPFLQVTVPEAGRYAISVGEASYKGSTDSRYVLFVRRGLRPELALPLGASAEEATPLTGLAATALSGSWQVPAGDARPSQGLSSRGVRAWLPPHGTNPLWFRVNSLPQHTEGVGVVSAPAALNGVISTPGEHDRWTLRLSKGQRVRVEAWARRLRSPLDPVLRIKGKSGRAENDDDAGSPDSALEFGAQADGEYELEVFDHLERGGPAFAYRIEVDQPRERAALETAGDVREVAIPAGAAGAVPLRLERGPLGAGARVEFGDLPDGVTADVLPLPAPVDVVPVLLRATEGAPVAARSSRVQLGPPGEGPRVELYQRTILVEGNNNTLFWGWDEDRLPISVRAPVPFHLVASAPAVPLPRSGQLELRLDVVRAEGFDGAVTAAVVFLPPGIDANRQRAFAQGEGSASITVQARADAALGRWPLVLVAEAEVDGVRARVAAEPVWLEVVEPFLTVQAAEAAVEQGAESAMVLTTSIRELPATGRARLVGLPHKVTSEELSLEGDTVELIFPLRAEADSPPGKHGAPGLQIVFDLEGGQVTQVAGTAQLRVQKPVVPVVAAKAEPEPVPKPQEKPAAPAARPLSRLEKLRQAANPQGGGQR